MAGDGKGIDMRNPITKARLEEAYELLREEGIIDMKSLDRESYRRIYEIGLTFFNYHESTEYEAQAIELMDIAESVIGPQRDRPDNSRDTDKSYIRLKK